MIATILLQHAEEVSLLWHRRDAAAVQPHYSLGDLYRLDDRLDAHLDGLRIAGEAGWELCREELRWQEAGEVFASAAVALDAGKKERIDEVLPVACRTVDLARGFVSAIGWLEWEQVSAWAKRLGESDDPMGRRIGLGGATAHRCLSLAALDVGLEDAESVVRERAMKAAGEMGRSAVLPVLRHGYASEKVEERMWSAWSGALLGDTAAVQVLRRVAEGGGVRAEQACLMAMRRARLEEALEWQRDLASRGDELRLAVIGAGAIGDPVLMPWIIGQMAKPELARVAGEAFFMITGVDLAYDDLDGEWPEGFTTGPTEAAEDEDVAMDRDENLPWPDPRLIQGWWEDHGLQFIAGTRYLLGKPMAEGGWLETVLRDGRQRQRAAAALELAIRNPGQPLFNVKAPGFQQKTILAMR